MGWDPFLAFLFVVNIFVAPEHHNSAQLFLLHPARDRLHYLCPTPTPDQ